MTIFDDIVSGTHPAWVVWEDDEHLAFLTPFATVPGQTIVIPKGSPGDYLFGIGAEPFHALLDACREVAHRLEHAFTTPRVAMIFEGTGIAHVHAKLYPLHGVLAGQTDVWSPHLEFHPEYAGYLTTAEGPRMPDAELDEIQARIVAAR